MGYKAASAEEIEEMKQVDELVFKFQAGDKQAGEQLMERFGCHPKHPFTLYIGKYLRILRNPDAFRFINKDERKFISCFIDDQNIRKKLTKRFQSTEVKVLAMRKLRNIVDQVKSVPDDELRQEMSLMFLEQVKRYEHKWQSKYFQGYLYNSYQYRLVDFVQKKMKKYDPYEHMYSKKQLLPLQEDRYVDHDTEIQLEDKMFTNQPLLREDDELGNAWIRGITCRPEFKELTPLQRQILKMYYEDDMTDGQIAKKMVMHINTIHNNRKRAIKKVQEAKERLFKKGNDA